MERSRAAGGEEGEAGVGRGLGGGGRGGPTAAELGSRGAPGRVAGAVRGWVPAAAGAQRRPVAPALGALNRAIPCSTSRNTGFLQLPSLKKQNPKTLIFGVSLGPDQAFNLHRRQASQSGDAAEARAPTQGMEESALSDPRASGGR